MEEFVVFSGSSNRPLAEAIAGELGMPLGGCEVERFPDGEVGVTIVDSVRDRQIFLVQPTSPPVNDHLMELVALADACRRAAAARVTAVVPYFGYARADRRKSRRVPIMARAAADILEASGVQHVVTIDLHSPQVEGFFRIPVENLAARSLLRDALGTRLNAETVVVAPDFGAIGRANALAETLGCSVAVIPKRRLDGRDVRAGEPIGDVDGRHCLILDDMISTGGTIIQAIEALRGAGAEPEIDVAATHGVFATGSRERLLSAEVGALLVSDSVAALAGEDERIRRVSVAPILATALQRLARGESLRDLY